MGRIAALEAVVASIKEARAGGARVVMCNGAFDLFHVGHLRYLQGARAHGDIVVVAVNSDASVRAAKGDSRPYVPEAERAEIVAAIEGVDWVVIFGEPTPSRIIEVLRPNIQAKGTDYTPDSIPEAALVRSYGGDVVIVGDPKDHSTTDMLKRMKPRS